VFAESFEELARKLTAIASEDWHSGTVLAQIEPSRPLFCQGESTSKLQTHMNCDHTRRAVGA
jgi:hypothetical protein